MLRVDAFFGRIIHLPPCPDLSALSYVMVLPLTFGRGSALNFQVSPSLWKKIKLVPSNEILALIDLYLHLLALS